MNILLITPENSVKGMVLIESLHKHFNCDQNIDIQVLLNETNSEGSIECYCKSTSINVYKTDDLSLKKSVSYTTLVDLCVVVGWGWIISKQFIQASPTILNCHSSFLPDYKGASVYLHQWANCERYGGATIHFLTDKIDEGDILIREQFMIAKNDEPKDILVKASVITAQLLISLIETYCLTRNFRKRISQSGGRYFLKTPMWKLKLHRFVNNILCELNCNYRWLTPNRTITLKNNS